MNKMFAAICEKEHFMSKKEFRIPVFSEEVRRSSLQLHEPRLSIFLINVWRSSLIIAFVEFFLQISVNQSINLFVQKRHRHWTEHQGRMQPPLTKRCP